MATANPIVATDWTLLVTAGDEFFLTFPDVAPKLAVAAVATQAAPTIPGHRLKPGQDSMNRALIGPGYIYAKSLAAHPVAVDLTYWPPA